MKTENKKVRVTCQAAATLPLKKLLPMQGDLKVLSEENFEKLKASILRHGVKFPFFVWRNGGKHFIIDAHQREKVLARLAIEGYEVPELPVAWIEARDKKEAREKILLCNSSYGTMTSESLDAFLKESDFDLQMLKSEMALPFDLSKLMGEEPEVQDAEPQIDRAAELQKEWGTKLGQLWQLGNHRIVCGDCTDAKVVEKLMADGVANICVTDPPYGLGIDGQKKSVAKNPKHNRKFHAFGGWDSSRPSKEFFTNLISIGRPTIIFGGNYFADLLPPSRGWLYWSKGQDGLTMSDGELAWTNLDKPLRSITVNRANLGNTSHPTQKPVQVMVFAIEFTETEGTIFDPFLGSGTTLIACENLSRICYGCEISPGYCAVILQRFKDATGKTPKLISK